jgi:nicotinate-nucleotide adenylyltransferase
MNSVALFGGSFDPPHIGHEAVIKALLELKYIDKVVVEPTFLNPFKTEFHAPSELRLEWLRAIFSQEKNVIVDDYEVALAKQVPTIETVKHFLEVYEKIFVVIGADNLQTLHKWRDYEELKKKVTFIIATRGATEIPENFIRLDIDEKVSSSSLRENMDKTKLMKIGADEIARYYKEKNAK